MPRPNGHQFIPQEHQDWAWDVSLVPDNDREYVRKDGSPQLTPGHLHFDESGMPRHASGMCAGRHDCPANTKNWRNKLAMAKWQKTTRNN